MNNDDTQTQSVSHIVEIKVRINCVLKIFREIFEFCRSKKERIYKISVYLVRVHLFVNRICRFSNRREHVIAWNV